MLRSILLSLVVVVSAFAADISGTWNMTVETEAGSGSPVFVFQQSGEKLTGTYSGQLGDAKVTGTVKGDAVEFSFEVAPAGDKVLAKYAGKIEGETIKGTVDIGGLAKGTFLGKRK